MMVFVQRDADGHRVITASNGSGTEDDPAIPVMDVTLQDQTTQPLQIPFAQPNATTTTLTSDVSPGDTVINVVSVAVFSAGDTLTLITSAGAFYSGTVLSIASLAITVDTPVDSTFTTATSEVISSTIDMDVSGTLASPQVFTIRGDVGDIDVPITIDITRIIGVIETATAPTLAAFGDLSALTNGLVLRRNNGNPSNIFNVKSNFDIVNRCYDLSQFAGSGSPFPDSEGLYFRMTFAGQSKHGVAIRLAPDESLEFLVQDNLSGLTQFRVFAQGHVVD